MILTLLFILILGISVFLLVSTLLKAIYFLYTQKSLISLKGNTMVLFCLAAALVGLIVGSQLMAYTPKIKTENGISELKEVNLNGRKQWITIRGENRNNPILLFLAGGPGGSQMAAVRYDLAELEKYFVVVNWDQPGSAKSYGSTDISSITVETYIEDGLALTEYLCAAMDQDKIVLIGESWGSALGIFMIDKKPELFHAMIGTGQMVAFLETEIIDYNTALQISIKNQDTKQVEKLKKNGEPPYYGKDVTWKSADYLNLLSSVMAKNPNISNAGYNTLRDLFSSEYGLLDKINYFMGIINTFNHVYPQLYSIDLRQDYLNLEVPVYFFLGRHDINAPTSLAEEYYELLTAPDKQIIWFEHSGHSPWINESDKFVEEILKITKIK